MIVASEDNKVSVSDASTSEKEIHEPRQGYRFERKYHVQDLPEVEIEMWIKRSPALFFECFPPRFINNIYFDTPDLSNYHENLSGQAARTKIRLRWYGEFLQSQEKTTCQILRQRRGGAAMRSTNPKRPTPDVIPPINGRELGRENSASERAGFGFT